MKKLIALLLAAVMMLSLTACGGPEILGTYETTIDLTSYVAESFDEGSELGGTELALENYLDNFSITVVCEFKEDGTYSQSIDPESLNASIEEMKSAVLVMMDDLLLKTFADLYKVYGYTVETKEDVEALTGMSWDDIFPTTLGMSAEEFLATLIDESIAESFSDTLMAEGKYIAKDGKLHMSMSLDEECSEDAYETYEIEGDTVTITGGVNIEDNELLDYPYVLTKIA